MENIFGKFEEEELKTVSIIGDKKGTEKLAKEAICGACGREEIPPHSMEQGTWFLCADSRKADCPYSLRIVVDTVHVFFDEVVCAFAYRRVE